MRSTNGQSRCFRYATMLRRGRSVTQCHASMQACEWTRGGLIRLFAPHGRLSGIPLGPCAARIARHGAQTHLSGARMTPCVTRAKQCEPLIEHCGSRIELCETRIGLCDAGGRFNEIGISLVSTALPLSIAAYPPACRLEARIPILARAGIGIPAYGEGFPAPLRIHRPFDAHAPPFGASGLGGAPLPAWRWRMERLYRLDRGALSACSPWPASWITFSPM